MTTCFAHLALINLWAQSHLCNEYVIAQCWTLLQRPKFLPAWKWVLPLLNTRGICQFFASFRSRQFAFPPFLGHGCHRPYQMNILINILYFNIVKEFCMPSLSSFENTSNACLFIVYFLFIVFASAGEFPSLSWDLAV